MLDWKLLFLIGIQQSLSKYFYDVKIFDELSQTMCVLQMQIG